MNEFLRFFLLVGHWQICQFFSAHGENIVSDSVPELTPSMPSVLLFSCVVWRKTFLTLIVLMKISKLNRNVDILLNNEPKPIK